MCVLVGADMPVAFLETGSRMHIFGDILGSTMVVRGALHIFAFNESSICMRLGSPSQLANNLSVPFFLFFVFP